VGGRLAFADLLRAGKLSALEIYPFRERLHQKGADFAVDALEVIGRFKPDIFFVQHVTGNAIPNNFWSKVREKFPKLTLVYHDADPYSAYSKRIDRPMKDILAQCHLSLICGLGFIQDEFKRLSNGPVRYSPHCFDRLRFRKHDVSVATKTCDLIMIGNRGTRNRLKFLYQPGGRDRARLAESASNVFGRSFALYGNGWAGLTADRGRLDFSEQERAIQSARISINWDHFADIPYYFSDRLPISLAAGVPHVTSYHPGYEHIFQDCRGLYACKNWQEVVECSRWLLSKGDDELLDLGLQAQRWVEQNLEAIAVFGTALEMSVKVHAERSGTGA
jgi:hypothetical protein